MPERTCSVEGCNGAHRGRGLCSTHYNQAYQPNRHKKITVPCGWCSKPCEKAADQSRGYHERFCSTPCRDAWRRANGYVLSPQARAKAREAQASMLGQAKRKLRKAARGTRGTHWVAGICMRCGSSFVSALGPDLGRYCSDSCKRRAGSSRRRAREHGVHHEPYSRQKIFERDHWRCHICKRMTLRTKVVPHPRAPVLDHLIPLAEGGPDTAANVATACFLCNSIKGERGGNEQLALM